MSAWTVGRRVFIAGSVLWALTLPLAPLAAGRPAPANAWYAIAFGVYAIGSFVCHQLPERSFHLWSVQMPVCARCTGVYVGGALAAVVVALRRRLPAADTGGNGSRAMGAAVVIAMLPTIVTLVYEWTMGLTPSNWIRALAGAPAGATVAFVVLAICRMQERSVRDEFSCRGERSDPAATGKVN